MAVFAVKGVAALSGALGTLYSKYCYATIPIARQTIALFAIAWDIARKGMFVGIVCKDRSFAS